MPPLNTMQRIGQLKTQAGTVPAFPGADGFERGDFVPWQSP